MCIQMVSCEPLYVGAWNQTSPLQEKCLATECSPASQEFSILLKEPFKNFVDNLE